VFSLANSPWLIPRPALRLEDYRRPGRFVQSPSPFRCVKMRPVMDVETVGFSLYSVQHHQLVVAPARVLLAEGLAPVGIINPEVFRLPNPYVNEPDLSHL